MKRTAIYSTLLSAGAAAPAFAGGKLPQMDPTWYPTHLVWLAASFIVLYLVVHFIITPKVGGVLSARAATIADAIAKAEAYKKTADDARGTAEAGYQEARVQVAEITARAQEEAARAHAEAMAKLNATLDAEAAKADAALKQAVSKATGELADAAAPLAQAIAEKLLGKAVDAASVKAASKAA